MFKSKSQILWLYLISGLLVLALYNSDPDWRSRIDVLGDCLLTGWIASLMNIVLFQGGLGKLFGIRPREPLGLLGIPFSAFFHRDIGHLVTNTVPFLMLGWLVVAQGGLQGEDDFYAITVTILLLGGFGTWLFGRKAIHLGASGLIFGYIGFLLASGYSGPTLLTLGFGVIVFLLYGSQLWGMMPSSSEETISWEGHLFGFLGGAIAAVEPDILIKVAEALDNLVQ